MIFDLAAASENTALEKMKKLWQIRQRRRQCRRAALLLATPDFHTFRHPCMHIRICAVGVLRTYLCHVHCAVHFEIETR